MLKGIPKGYRSNTSSRYKQHIIKLGIPRAEKSTRNLCCTREKPIGSSTFVWKIYYPALQPNFGLIPMPFLHSISWSDWVLIHQGQGQSDMSSKSKPLNFDQDYTLFMNSLAWVFGQVTYMKGPIPDHHQFRLKRGHQNNPQKFYTLHQMTLDLGARVSQILYSSHCIY